MPQPRAVIFDSRTVQSAPESGAGAGYDGHKRCHGRKTHLRRRPVLALRMMLHLQVRAPPRLLSP